MSCAESPIGPDAAAQRVSNDMALSGRPKHQGNLVVVDDTLESLRLLTGMLGEQGYEVRPVASGAQALLTIEHRKPDLILLDVNMPDMDGHEVCQRLKAQPELADIPVIFITALSEVADKVRGFEVGGSDYITKPFNLDEVLARVRVHVALQRARLDLSSSYERLQALETMRETLVSMLVHDMRSPLTVLMSHLHFLGDGENSSSSNESLHAAITATNVLVRMANDLLDVSRMESHALPLERALADLTSLANGVAANLSVLELDRKIEVSTQVEVPALCDASIIRRVLENLVSNAIKHTPKGCAVCISITPEADRVRVAVNDSGPGVPVELREKIFEKFGAAAARNERYHSVGLGLAFSKLAVEAHGGRIGVEPREGGGSSFWFHLPN